MELETTRENFVRRFGEEDAAAIEGAAAEHKPNMADSDVTGSDPFRDAIAICIGFECMSVDDYREYHGIAPDWEELRVWIRERGNLAEHDGPKDYLAIFGGAYNEFVEEAE